MVAGCGRSSTSYVAPVTLVTNREPDPFVKVVESGPESKFWIDTLHAVYHKYVFREGAFTRGISITTDGDRKLGFGSGLRDKGSITLEIAFIPLDGDSVTTASKIKMILRTVQHDKFGSIETGTTSTEITNPAKNSVFSTESASPSNTDHFPMTLYERKAWATNGSSDRKPDHRFALIVDDQDTSDKATK